ncbi:MAG: exonuclease SbcCD subunit D [Candidatus Melainabacteria bacterium]|nr:exonuclease SbcCD subunit D [Candidatus Melainabacteria bacterium]
MIKIVHFSDLHFGSGERYGSLNPETGLHRRFEDFISALDKPVNFAIDKKVDMVIFTGDTYKHATPEPVYQREFAKRIKKLSKNKILTILLVGNHDILYRIDGSDTLDIYSTLSIEHVTVFNKIELKNIETRNGIVQVITLPHITKSRLLIKDEYRNLNLKEQDKLMIQKVKEAISAMIEKLDPKSPSILIGHGTIETAQFGSEQDLSIGKVLSYPLSIFQNTQVDYVGFGHIHRHQVLQKENPLILYAGSLERVDFSEENEDKGFIYLELEKGKVNHKFISTNPRKFITINCDLTNSKNPQLDFENKVNEVNEVKSKKEAGAIVRVKYKINEENAGLINQTQIKKLLSDSFAFLIQSEIVNKERTYRISELDSNLITNPLSTLEKYLFEYKDEEKNILLEKAKEIVKSLPHLTH